MRTTLSAVAILSVALTLFVVSSASLLVSGCAAALECGSWTVNGTTQSGFGSGALSKAHVTSAFTFTPANCGKNCNCSIDAMIQMVSIWDTAKGTHKYSTSGEADRATANGWAIDRIDGAGYGWYGLLNDGMSFDPLANIPGSNGSPNTLYDNPNQADNALFFAVDVAVCFKSDTCQNKILGYYFWAWAVDNTGTASQLADGPAWSDLEAEFQNAVASWNSWAPHSGPETSSEAGGLLPNAVQFPPFSDL